MIHTATLLVGLSRVQPETFGTHNSQSLPLRMSV